MKSLFGSNASLESHPKVYANLCYCFNTLVHYLYKLPFNKRSNERRQRLSKDQEKRALFTSRNTLFMIM